MVRTQIYLDERQKLALEKLSAIQGASMSDLIRKAVDQFINRVSPDFDKALDRSFGIWRHRQDLDEPSLEIRKMRSEWRDREKRN